MAEREKEVIYTDGGGRGGGTLIAVVVAILVLLVVLYFVFGRGMLGGSTQKVEADVKIDTPAKGSGG